MIKDIHTVVKGHYLEVHKSFKNVTLLSEDISKVVAVSSYCIPCISPVKLQVKLQALLMKFFMV